MAPASDSPAGSIRLADQIERLSELMETITYRTIELEERLLHQEERLAAQDLEALIGSAADIRARLERDSQIWGDFIRARGLRLE